ncbi:MAG: tetratricopeptide repeat protein, partial [Candidatus Brocadiales bacterium]
VQSPLPTLTVPQAPTNPAPGGNPPQEAQAPSPPVADSAQLTTEGTGPSLEVLCNFCAGYHALLDGNWDKATQYFEKALGQDPRSERLLKYVVGCYVQAGKTEKALEYIKRLSEISPDDFRIHYSLGDLYQREERIEEAIGALERATRSDVTGVDPNLVADALYRLANMYLQKGEPFKAIPCFKDIFRLDVSVDYSLLYCQLGMAYAEAKDFLNAKEKLEQAKALNPSLGQARMYLAMVHEELGELQEAIQESEAFLDVSPETWVAYAYLAGLYKKVSRLEEAEFVQGKAINLLVRKVAGGSRDQREYLALAQLLIAQQRGEEALRVLENGIKAVKEEKSKDLRLLLANLYYEANHEEATERELKDILRMDPDSHEANNFLGYFYAESGKELGEALRLVEKALQAQPNNSAYIDSLGWVYYKQATEGLGDPRLEQALQKLLEAARESPDPEIFKHIGEVYYSLGQWEAAGKEWQRAFQNPPKGSKDEQIRLWIQEKLQRLDFLKKLEEKLQREEYPSL